MSQRRALAAIALFTVACGDRNIRQAPSSSNFAPIISDATASPTFGIQDLTTFTFRVLAHDPEGGPLTYRWELEAGTPGPAGPTATATFASGGQRTALVTAFDVAGNSASLTTNPFIVGSMSGQWSGSSPNLGDITMALEQRAGGVVTGTFNSARVGGGPLDPARPGEIDAEGNVVMRIAMVGSPAFEMRGMMDDSGRGIAGLIHGAGFDEDAFTLTKAAAQIGVAPTRFPD